MIELPKKKYVRPDEVADYLYISKSTVYVWCQNGSLESSKMNGVLRITRDSVIEFEKAGFKRRASPDC